MNASGKIKIVAAALAVVSAMAGSPVTAAPLIPALMSVVSAGFTDATPVHWRGRGGGVAAEGLDWLQVSQRAWSWAACSLHRATTMGRIQIILMNTRRDMEARSVTARLDGGDGRKALFLRNHGDEKFPNLRAEKVFEDENPPTHEQGSERPGRVSEAALTGRRSAVEPTDWHDIEEHRFARQVAAAMEQIIRTGKTKGLIVVAPPRTLAELRKAFHSDVKASIITEINKDLTKHPIGEIERHLTGDAG